MEINILAVRVVFNDIVDMGDIDVGALTVTRNGRNFIWDSCSTEFYEYKGETTAICKMGVDKELFEEGETYNYQLTAIDLLAAKSQIHSTFYVGGDYTANILSITAFFKIGRLTVCIDVEQE